MADILLDNSDPYVGGEIQVFPDGTRELHAPEYKLKEGYKYESHKLVAGERLDQVAGRFYADKVQNPPQYWRLIAVANNIDKAWDLDGFVGLILRIPDIQEYKINNQ